MYFCSNLWSSCCSRFGCVGSRANRPNWKNAADTPATAPRPAPSHAAPPATTRAMTDPIAEPQPPPHAAPPTTTATPTPRAFLTTSPRCAAPQPARLLAAAYPAGIARNSPAGSRGSCLSHLLSSGRAARRDTPRAGLSQYAIWNVPRPSLRTKRCRGCP